MSSPVSRRAAPSPRRPPSSPALKKSVTSAKGGPAPSPKKKAPSKKKGSSTPKKKTVAHNIDGDLIVQEEPALPTGIGQDDDELEVASNSSARASAPAGMLSLDATTHEPAGDDEDLAPDAAALLAEALASFRAPASHRPQQPPLPQQSRRAVQHHVPPASAPMASGATVYSKLYTSEANADPRQGYESDDEEVALSLPPGVSRALHAPPPISLSVPPPAADQSPPPPPGRCGDAGAPTMLSAALSQISGGLESHRLRPTAEVHDRSTPLIDQSITLKKSVAPQLFAELSAGLESHRLRHVESVNDRSAPVIESELKIKPSAHASLVDEIKHKRGFIDQFINRRSRMQTTNETLSAIAAVGPNPAGRLRKAKGVNDRSAPFIDPSLGIKRSAMPELFAQLKSESGSTMLRHVESNDRSAPVIEAEVRISKSTRGEMFDELKRKVSSVLTAISEHM